jgi:hypothetical protein
MNNRNHTALRANGRRYAPVFYPNHTELLLMESCATIGSACDLAAWASGELAAKIEQMGRSVESLTVGELRDLIRGIAR